MNPNYDVTHKKAQIQNFPIFKNRLSVSLEDLNSSLAQSTADLWPNTLVPVGAKSGVLWAESEAS